MTGHFKQTTHTATSTWVILNNIHFISTANSVVLVIKMGYVFLDTVKIFNVIIAHTET
jgi:hypothetical protein